SRHTRLRPSYRLDARQAEAALVCVPPLEPPSQSSPFCHTRQRVRTDSSQNRLFIRCSTLVLSSSPSSSAFAMLAASVRASVLFPLLAGDRDASSIALPSIP